MQTKGDKISKAYSYADIERMNFKINNKKIEINLIQIFRAI